MRRVKGCLCVVAVLALTGTAQAEPLNHQHVSADAGWLGHVDFDAVRESTVARHLVRRHMEHHPQTDAHLKMLQGLTGMNLLTDLHGLTFYGRQVGNHSGVVILHAKMNKTLLQGWAERIPRRETSAHGDHAIQSWTGEHRGHKHTLASAWHGQDRLVLASGVDDLRAALDVIDGKSDSVGADAPLAGNIPSGTTVLLRAVGISSIPCKAPLVQQTESFRFVVGEHNGESFYRWRLVMNNAETAGELKEVVEGFRAVLSLGCCGQESSKKLVDATNIKFDDKTLTVLWSASAEDVWTVMEAQIKILEARLAKHLEHRKHRGGQGRGKHDHGGHDHGGHGDKPADSQPKRSAEEDF